MDVIIHHQYQVDKKEPLADMLRRVLGAFGEALLIPTVSASFTDDPGGSRVSAVDRALKKHPDLSAFLRTEKGPPGLPATRSLTGGGDGASFPIDALLTLALGVPRSLPFNAIQIQFGHPEFSGSKVGDHWWVNGRKRSFNAVYTLHAGRDEERLPDPPPGVARVGTWSRMVMVQYAIRGIAADVRLHVPVGTRALGAQQYPIGDTSNWKRIVENLAATVDELERSLLPEIEEIIGESPGWFEPMV